jgi:hypothetical protein
MITYKNTFEEKIKPFLTYVGAIGAVFSGIMYILATIVLIMGFQAKTFTQAIVFAVVSAILGLIIMFFLRYQGLSFAKAIPENQEVLNKYNNKQAKTKHHTLKYFWIKNTIIDVLIKGCTVALSTAGIIYIVIEGSQDFKLILLAIANLILFACLGLIALANAYDFYNEQWVPYMNEQIELRNKPPEPEIQPRIDEQHWVDKDIKNDFIMTSEAEFGTQG